MWPDDLIIYEECFIPAFKLAQTDVARPKWLFLLDLDGWSQAWSNAAFLAAGTLRVGGLQGTPPLWPKSPFCLLLSYLQSSFPTSRTTGLSSLFDFDHMRCLKKPGQLCTLTSHRRRSSSCPVAPGSPVDRCRTSTVEVLVCQQAHSLPSSLPAPGSPFHVRIQMLVSDESGRQLIFPTLKQLGFVRGSGGLCFPLPERLLLSRSLQLRRKVGLCAGPRTNTLQKCALRVYFACLSTSDIKRSCS